MNKLITATVVLNGLVAFIIMDHWLPEHTFWTWVAIIFFIGALDRIVVNIGRVIGAVADYLDRGYWL